MSNDLIDEDIIGSSNSYRLQIKNNLIKEIDIDKVVFLKTSAIIDENVILPFNELDRGTLNSRYLDLLSDSANYIVFDIQPTNNESDVPFNRYLMEYDVYDEWKLSRIIDDATTEVANRKMDKHYIGELYTYNESISNNGNTNTYINKVLKVIYPSDLYNDKYKVMLIGKSNGNDSPSEYDYSYAMYGELDSLNYSGIANIIYTNNVDFEGVDKLMLSIHKSNYSYPHLAQIDTLSSSIHTTGYMLSNTRILESKDSANIPYKNILMNKDYSVTFLGNYMYS